MLDIVESKRKKPTVLLDGVRYTQDKKFLTQLFIGNVEVVHVLHVLYNMLQIHQSHNHHADEMKCKVEDFKTTY